MFRKSSILCTYAHLVLNGGHILNALVERVPVLGRQLVAASVAAVNVNSRMVQTVDHAVVVAVLHPKCRLFHTANRAHRTNLAHLSETGHVTLHGARRTRRLIGAIAVRCLAVWTLSVHRRFAGVRPIRPRDAEKAADIAAAGQRLVAAADRLTDAAEADLRDRLLLLAWKY